MYDNPHMDSYLSDEQDGEHGGGLGSIHAFGGMGMGDEMDNDEKALLGGPAKRKVGCGKASFRRCCLGTQLAALLCIFVTTWPADAALQSGHGMVLPAAEIRTTVSINLWL